MPVKLNGATSGSVELNVPAAIGSDLQLTLPATAGEVIVKAADGSVDLGSVDIDSSGRVGIGESSPRVSLDVKSGSSGYSGGLGAGSIASLESSGTAGLQFLSPNDQSNCIYFGDANSNSTGSIQYAHSTNALTLHVNGGTERMRIDSSGNVGVGISTIDNTYSSSYSLQITSRSDNNWGGSLVLSSANGTNVFSRIISSVNGLDLINTKPTNIRLFTNNTERMRIDSAGKLLLGATAAVSGADANGLLQVSQNVGTNTCIIVAENTASSGNLSCFRARLRNSNPNSIFSAFLQCDASTGGSKAVIRSNGGLANYSANNANLSDRNAKKDITAAADTWNCIKEWEIVNYRYKDQPDDVDLNLGVIAQQIAESCPEVITIFQEAKEATETEPAQEERLGVKEQQMHWMAIKALQEAIAKIETLETKVASLEASS